VGLISIISVFRKSLTFSSALVAKTFICGSRRFQLLIISLSLIPSNTEVGAIDADEGKELFKDLAQFFISGL